MDVISILGKNFYLKTYIALPLVYKFLNMKEKDGKDKVYPPNKIYITWVQMFKAVFYKDPLECPICGTYMELEERIYLKILIT